MEEIISRAECYIKGEESNAEKRARDAKEKILERKSYDTVLLETAWMREDFWVFLHEWDYLIQIVFEVQNIFFER